MESAVGMQGDCTRTDGAPVILAAVSDGTDFDAALTGLAVAGLVVTAVLLWGPGRRLLREAAATGAVVPSP